MINNNIQESYCSLEVSKLLKEKGFNVLCPQGYDTNDLEYQRFGLPKGIQFGICSNTKESSVVASTHALAIEWIRVNFGIHIWIASKDIDGKDVLYIGNARNIPVKKDSKGFIIDPLPYNPKSTPQQATEAALLFTLKNLIP